MTVSANVEHGVGQPPTQPILVPAEMRFWVKVQRGPDCWEWLGHRDRGTGYGDFRVGDKHVKAHRFSYQTSYGQIPKGLFVLHRCDNPPCVRPSHLYLGTTLDNTRDMFARGRASLRHGEHNGKARLTWIAVRRIRRVYSGKYGELTDLARYYGVDACTIGDIVAGRTWPEK